MNVCPVGDKTNSGKALRTKAFPKNLFYHQRTNIHDFIPIFVFVPDFVTNFVTNSVTNFVTNFVPDFVKNQKQ